MKRLAFLLALVLPVAVLASLWGLRQATLSSASDWRIPVEGADPRDLLRGRFVAFTYGWQVAGDPARCPDERRCTLCLSADAGRVIATIAAAPAQACRFRVDVAASRLSVRPGARGEPPLFGGRLFVSEASAPALERRLQQGPMIATARLTEDGRLLVTALVPGG